MKLSPECFVNPPNYATIKLQRTRQNAKGEIQKRNKKVTRFALWIVIYIFAFYQLTFLMIFKLYNSLSRAVEDFQPINPPKVGMYTCGPTVYQFAHIGNFRAYMTADLLVRVLRQNNYDVKFVMNITDVGHLVSDADTGEDKLEKSAKEEGKTAWEIADYYTHAFLKDYDALNLTRPDVLAKATDHIQEQIHLVETLQKKGFTYTLSDGVYFDTSKLPDYGKLSTLDQIKEGARVEIHPEKRNPRDFALWKLSPKGEKRYMEWESPWGKGFPGWHIECSAMSMKYLGETFDIHTGGIDHIPIHHTNEIAQSEAATGKKFVNYWVHTAFMLVDGQKMSKSLGNIYTLSDLKKRGFTPMHLRYLYLQTHYRQEMNFTWESLEAAKNTLQRLQKSIVKWDAPTIGCAEYEVRFFEALHDDLNTPQALSILWELVRSEYPTSAKAKSLFTMDKVLGFGFEEYAKAAKTSHEAIPQNVQSLLEMRKRARLEKDYERSDELRQEILKLGYEVEDTPKGVHIKKII